MYCTIVGSRDDIFPSVIVVLEPVAEGTSVTGSLILSQLMLISYDLSYLIPVIDLMASHSAIEQRYDWGTAEKFEKR